jgi:uncharacterized protein YdaU (DUF1376 family)
MVKTKSIRTRKDPAFLFYSADFLVETQFWSDGQVGKYVRLLCYQHQMGHITEEIMLHYCQDRDTTIFRKFIKDENDLYYNKELEDEIKRRTDVSTSKSNNANKGWDKRKRKINPNNQYTYIPEYDDNVKNK